MDKNRIDFSSIDFTRDKNRYDDAVKRIVKAASMRVSISGTISAKFAPILAICAIILIISGLFLTYNLKSKPQSHSRWSGAYKYWKTTGKSADGWKKIDEMRVKSWTK